MTASPLRFEEVHGLPVTQGTGLSTDRETPAQADAQVDSLVREHLASVWRFLRRLGLSPADADDAAQEVFLVATRKMDRIEEGHARRFLFGIAVRIASRARRSQKTRSDKLSGSDVEACLSPELDSDELLARKEARVLLDQALEELKPEFRTTFVLYELEEMTMIEIAAVTEAPLGTVASRLRRAREQFQQVVLRLQRAQAGGER